MPPILQVTGLRKSFGGVSAVDGVTLAVEPGEIRAVIGPNGAGKSTLFDLLTGWLRPDGGQVQWEGADVTGWPPERLALMGIGRTFQRSNNFINLSVLDNILTALFSRDSARRQWWQDAYGYRDRISEALELLDETGLKHLASRPVRELAYGDQKRLDIAIGLALRPRLLIMDEPLAGLAPPERSEILTLIRSLVSNRGLTVLFSEHDLDSVMQLADRITVLHQGKVLAEGSAADITANIEVRAVFLGDRVRTEEADVG